VHPGAGDEEDSPGFGGIGRSDAGFEIHVAHFLSPNLLGAASCIAMTIKSHAI
jgi:hypothetical protein